jgi:hypothetical protein
MEPATGFDLTAARERWRQALAAREAITAERARELETHLDDVSAELRTRGLSAEEAFWVAAHRLGDPLTLGEQFATADPAPVWRNRVFWIALGILLNLFAQPLVMGFAALLYFIGVRTELPWLQNLVTWIFPLLFIGGAVGLFVGLAHGRFPRLSRFVERCCSRRKRYAWQFFALAALPALAALAFSLLLLLFHPPGSPNFPGRPLWIVLYPLWPMALACLAAVYAPQRPTAQN